MSTVDIESFRTRLLEEREATAKAIAYHHDENPAASREDEEVEFTGGGGDNHLADMATVTYDRELDFTLEESEGQRLASIDAALERLEAGTFGTCANCGKPIAQERLEAMPWATLCIDCKRLAERA